MINVLALQKHSFKFMLSGREGTGVANKAYLIIKLYVFADGHDDRMAG